MLIAEYVVNNWQKHKHKCSVSKCSVPKFCWSQIRLNLSCILNFRISLLMLCSCTLCCITDHVETWSETESAWFLILSQITLLPNLFLWHHIPKYKNVSLCFIVVWIADSWIFPDQESICRETYKCTLSSRVICFCMCGLLTWARVHEFILLQPR